jgi:hypothetical protein
VWQFDGTTFTKAAGKEFHHPSDRIGTFALSLQQNRYNCTIVVEEYA